jgi:hypothetical protein
MGGLSRGSKDAVVEPAVGRAEGEEADVEGFRIGTSPNEAEDDVVGAGDGTWCGLLPELRMPSGEEFGGLLRGGILRYKGAPKGCACGGV